MVPKLGDLHGFHKVNKIVKRISRVLQLQLTLNKADQLLINYLLIIIITIAASFTDQVSSHLGYSGSSGGYTCVWELLPTTGVGYGYGWTCK